MKLTRKHIYHLWLAGQIIEKVIQEDQSKQEDQKKLRINVTAKMFLRKNQKEIAGAFAQIKQHELKLVSDHQGYFIQGLGITQFFSSPEEREEFIKNEEKFNKELGTIKQMAETLASSGGDIMARINEDFERARNKFLKTADPEKAKENLNKYNQAFSEFLTSPEGTGEYNVHQVKAAWFEDTYDLPQAFIDHYEEAGMISYDLDQ